MNNDNGNYYHIKRQITCTEENKTEKNFAQKKDMEHGPSALKALFCT